jgi:hypothetical protein
MKHLELIFTKLNFNKDNGLILLDNLSANEYNNSMPERISKILLETIKPDAVFCIDNKPIILFFDQTQNKTRDLKVLFKIIWNSNEIPIVFVVNDTAIDIYNGFKLLQDENILQLEKLDKVEQSDFEYYKLISGETWNKCKLDNKGKSKVDYKLLNNVKFAQQEIVEQLQQITDYKDSITLANSLIAKIIYIRYLIDRTDVNGKKINLGFQDKISENTLKNNQDLCDLLQENHITSLFEYLKQKFNGDLFQFTPQDYCLIDQLSFEPLIKLLKGYDFAKHQYPLFDLYDFSIIPVELISHIYELFLGEKQKNNSAYYTPLFLVDYVLSQTLELDELKNNKLYTVLDPSCGSGLFLVEVLRKNIAYYKKNHNKKSLNLQEIKDIAKNNIFGIDKDSNAIEIAILSVYLILLGEQTSAEIEQFKFPKLLDNNFFVADYFDETHKFNNVLKEKKIDFIIGNPPWGTVESDEQKQSAKKKKQQNEPYEVWYKEHHKHEIPDKQISQAFLLRNLDFCSENSECAMVVTSKLLYNNGAKQFRKHLLNNTKIRQVLELSLLRKDLFKKHVWNTKTKEYKIKSVQNPATVLIYSHSKQNINNNIQYMSVKPSNLFKQFKIIAVYKPDIQYIPQQLFLEYDYLWKVRHLGAWVDFNLVKQIKTLPTINTLITEKNYIASEGLQRKNKDTKPEQQNNARHLIGRKIIESQHVKQFNIKYDDNQDIWKDNTVHRPRDVEIYNSPSLLIRHSFKIKDFKLTATMLYQDNSVFTNSLYSITGAKNHKNSIDSINKLKVISAFINSKIAQYLNLLTSSCSAIEREQIYPSETTSLPFIYDEQLVNYVNEIEKYYTYHANAPKAVKQLMQKIDDRIFELLELSVVDRIAIDYAINYTIPLINMKPKDNPQSENSPIRALKDNKKEDKEFINQYVQIFLDDFNRVYSYSNLMLTAKVIITNRIIATFFEIKALDSNLANNPAFTTLSKELSEDETLKLIIEKLHVLGIEKVTEKIYFMKDVRGFQEHGFYIIKANEKRLWHQYYAHIDLEEVVHAIHMAGR